MRVSRSVVCHRCDALRCFFPPSVSLFVCLRLTFSFSRFLFLSSLQLSPPLPTTPRPVNTVSLAYQSIISNQPAINIPSMDKSTPQHARSNSDPFLDALRAQQANESQDERHARLRREAEAKKISDAIDEQLKAEEKARAKRRTEVKILLLGSLIPRCRYQAITTSPPIYVPFPILYYSNTFTQFQFQISLFPANADSFVFRPIRIREEYNSQTIPNAL